MKSNIEYHDTFTTKNGINPNMLCYEQLIMSIEGIDIALQHDGEKHSIKVVFTEA